MTQDLKDSLSALHDKQDLQTEKLGSLELALSKQQFALETYVKHSDKMTSELEKMNDNLTTYNAELKVHIAGVIELKEQNRLMREEIRQRDEAMDLRLKERDELINSRLSFAEKPILWFKSTGDFLKWAAPVGAGIVTVVLGILKIMGKI